MSSTTVGMVMGPIYAKAPKSLLMQVIKVERV